MIRKLAKALIAILLLVTPSYTAYLYERANIQRRAGVINIAFPLQNCGVPLKHYAGRFVAGLPRKNDARMLFLQHMRSKMRPEKPMRIFPSWTSAHRWEACNDGW